MKPAEPADAQDSWLLLCLEPPGTQRWQEQSCPLGWVFRCLLRRAYMKARVGALQAAGLGACGHSTVLELNSSCLCHRVRYPGFEN